MEITYTKCGDVYLPDLIIEDDAKAIGKYGRMRNRYLKENRPGLYSNMLLAGKLFQHLAEIDEACENRMELMISQKRCRKVYLKRSKPPIRWSGCAV